MIINKYYSDIKRPMFDERAEFLKNKDLSIDLIYFGDSILQGFDASRFGGSSKYILNSAIGGDTLDFMAKRIVQDVFVYSPKQVLFLGGINDIRGWYNENRVVSEIDDFARTILSKYIHIVDKCIEQKIKIYPCTIILNSEDKNNYPFLNLVINEINLKLIEYFISNEIEYINLNEVLVNKYSFLSRDLTDDGLHPNDYGNLEIYKVLIEKGVL